MTPAISFETLPFDEAIKFFNDKNVVTPDIYRAMTAEQKARAFTIGGTARMDVLTDLHRAIGRAIEEGTTFQDFKKSAKEIMTKRGWEGTTPYRLDTIYRTNIQSAYQAGHCGRQLQVVAAMPYWQYAAVMDSRTRPAHAVMNGRVLRYDDPFWTTSYPPNGFRCRCTVRALTEGNVSREKLKIEKAVPGIADPGFDTNPSLSYMTDLTAWQKAQKAPPDIRRVFVDAMVKNPARPEAFGTWIDEILKDGKARGKTAVAGWMDTTTLDYLEAQNVRVTSPVIIADDRGILHATRSAKQKRGNALSLEEIKTLPDIVANAEAVLWDRQDPALLYVTTGKDETIKVVTRVNYRLKGSKEPVNIVATAGKLKKSDLMQARYEIVKGKL